MANKWGIPKDVEETVKSKYKSCVYCNVPFSKNGGKKPTLEHIDNDGPNFEPNVVMCCNSCNASKGTKNLSDWLNSNYCKEKKISKATIAKGILNYL